MTGPDQPEDTPAADEAPRGDQEATWLITPPPPPPPPMGASLPPPGRPQPTPPPAQLPTTSTPPVNVPPAERPGPAAGERVGPVSPSPSPPGAVSPPSTLWMGPPPEGTTPLAEPDASTPPLTGSAAATAAGMPDDTAALSAVEATAAQPTDATVSGAPPSPFAPSGPASVSPSPFAPSGPGGEGGGVGGGVLGGVGGPTVPPEAAAAAGAGLAGGAAASNTDPQQSHRHPLAGGTAVAKAALHEVREISAWMLAAAALLVAFVIGWLAGIVLSFRHAPGLTARDRILQFFEPGTLGWAIAVLLAIGLFEVGRRSDPVAAADPAETVSDAHRRKRHFVHLLPFGLLLAAAGVTVSALVGVLVELSNFGNGIDRAFSALINYLALVAVGAAATWLAFKETEKTPPR